MALDLFGNKTLQAIADLAAADQARFESQTAFLQLLFQKVNALMANQDELNVRVEQLHAAIDAIAAAIDALKASAGDTPVDFTGLDAEVARAQGLVA